MAEYTEQQLIGALRKADAAGDTAAARAIAQRIKAMRQPAATPPAPQPAEPAPDPTEGMSGFDKFSAGVGKSFADTYRGLKQAGTEAVDFVAGGGVASPVGIADRLVRGRESNRYDNPVTRATGRSLDRQQADIDRAKTLDAPLMDTGAGAGGNVVGTLAQILGPGIVARGTAAGAALLPRTIAGNAAQGGIVGLLQPTASGDNRATNVAAGAAFGTVGAALPAGGGKLLSLLRRAGSGATLSGAERKAAETIAAESSGLQQLMAPQPSAIPGVQRTLAEESLDPGVARLERQVRGQTNIFQPIDTANNAARVRAIEGFAGDDAALSAAKSERSRQALPKLAASYLDRGVNVSAIRDSLGEQIKANATRPSVQSALTDVQRALDNAGDDVFSLYGVRKYIGDLLSGKAGADKSYAKAASKELKDLQGVLDEEIAKKSPSFASYLDTFREGSKPINRMQTGQQLLAPDSGGAVLDPQTGLQVLTPASFSRKARNLDAVAAKATGFKKAKASDILSPDDLAVIRDVQDDLERQAFRSTAGSGGNSMTAERLALQDKLGARLAGKLPIVGGFVETLNGLGQQRVNERLAYLLANPDEARRVLSALNQKDRSTLNKALFQLSARPAAAAPAIVGD